MKEVSRERLKEIWCELNRWKGVPELPGLSKEAFIGAMLAIELIIPRDEILEVWNRPRSAQAATTREEKP
jgi:hypothetical protein